MSMKNYVPTRNSETSPRSSATTLCATIRPVRGFSEGTFSIVIEKQIGRAHV